ncbi:DUF4244 domain-containing protein [Brevibacterium sp.]|uniref:DUF4244 domain-containing protein n=1 Tax=Brevibacterium sp. TaxID=1701 RepID=UPI0026496960|nr:DUF4244 domain-containing protein [Brevibacterium sp.]MDN6602807.1 DUF4244 domain-containing protein [Brevibacterium sp.]
MSIGTKANDCDGPLYPQWGESRRVGAGDGDWAGRAQYSGADTDIDGADTDIDGADTDTDIDTDSVVAAMDAVADAINSAEPQRDDGIPESWGPDAGATTAEYAITTLAACGFAALLVIILKSEPIKELVTGVIETALGLGV